jgi:isochorismate synthase
MSSFAIFRLPYEQQHTFIQQTAGQPLELRSCAELSGQSGFVVAPFMPSDSRPILVIRPDVVTHDVPWSQLQVSPSACSSSLADDPRSDYHIDFANFHAHLVNGDFSKLVLSRSIFIPADSPLSPVELYQKACASYPRMMIILVSTPQSGTWLVATPEILLSGRGAQWQTVALAGTMPFSEQVLWSDKNIQEQRYVATYITEQLEQFTSDFTETGPRTVRAGHLAHLRSDFHFQLNDTQTIGEIIQTLHPTPAVCGLPKHQALDFILHNEHHDRSYYSGFMGPLFVGDTTHLFVTLRCMQLFTNGYHLYAGGGILCDSQEEQEWHETEIKLDTMKYIVHVQQ